MPLESNIGKIARLHTKTNNKTSTHMDELFSQVSYFMQNTYFSYNKYLILKFQDLHLYIEFLIKGACAI